MARVYLSNDDVFYIIVYDTDETTDMFGKDMLTDYGIDIPDELLARYKRIFKEYQEVQDKLYLIYRR